MNFIFHWLSVIIFYIAEWCTPGQFVCPNSQVCVDQHRLCDGTRDCPYGDDEKQCVTVAQNEAQAGDFQYSSEGILLIVSYLWTSFPYATKSYYYKTRKRKRKLLQKNEDISGWKANISTWYSLLIKKDSMIIKTFQLSFRVFMCAFHLEISSFFW